MINRLPNDRIHVWAGALIAIASAFSLFLIFASSILAHERIPGTETVFHAEHEDFVGAEPPVCNILEFDGPLQGEIFGNSPSDVGKIWASFEQFGCQITGKLEINLTNFSGSGPFYGVVDGNVLRFTVTSETSDAPRDLNFSGLIDGDRISGQYSIPHTDFVSDWTLFIGGSGFVTRLREFRDSVVESPLPADIQDILNELAELRQRRSDLAVELDHQLEIDSAEVIGHWELAIEELRAEVEHEIGLETSRVESEKVEVTRRLGRNRVVGELEKELQLLIEQMWVSFDEEAALKMDLMEQELSKLKIIKATQLDRLSRMINSVQSELDQKLERTGITLNPTGDQVVDPVSHETPDNTLVQPNDSPKENVATGSETRVADSEVPGPPSDSSKNDGQRSSRGFFFNSESGAIGELGGSLDPTTLAVIGILITLAATAVQLVKGN